MFRWVLTFVGKWLVPGPLAPTQFLHSSLPVEFAVMRAGYSEVSRLALILTHYIALSKSLCYLIILCKWWN